MAFPRQKALKQTSPNHLLLNLDEFCFAKSGRFSYLKKKETEEIYIKNIGEEEEKIKIIGALTFLDGLNILSNLDGGFQTKRMKR